jgi:endoribonuclease Dicer
MDTLNPLTCSSKGQTPSERAAELADHCGLSVGVYDASSKPTLAYWSELTTRDVIVIDAVVSDVCGYYMCSKLSRFLQSLLESLACGSLAIPQIHFLVIHDAGTIQRDAMHPIRSVMSEYYLITDTLSRPRVFAFLQVDTPTRSSSDRHALERILDATEYSHDNESAKEDTPSSKPSEMVVFYEPNINCVETTLLKRLHSFDPDETVFRSHFRNATLALTDLGPCASDLVWRRALKDIDLAVPHVFNDEDDEDATDTLEGLLARTKANIRNAIKNWVFAMPNLDASSRGYNVSSKLSKLIGILKACEPEGDGFRGVIFGAG